MRSIDARGRVLAHLARQGHLSLFLDYDGTLVPIAPTPEEAIPDSDLLDLLSALSSRPSIRTVVLSGRPLDKLQRLLPIDGLILAGLYGVEMRIGRNTLLREPARDGRVTLDKLREGWARLAGGLSGFLLEDKGQALALHARWADADEAAQVLSAARDMATDLVDIDSFRIVEGDRFLEIAPAGADKGESVDWLLSHFPIQHDLPVAFGDDNKDDGAFSAARKHGGMGIGVGHRYPLPQADARVGSHEDVREWLRAFLAARPTPAIAKNQDSRSM